MGSSHLAACPAACATLAAAALSQEALLHPLLLSTLPTQQPCGIRCSQRTNRTPRLTAGPVCSFPSRTLSCHRARTPSRGAAPSAPSPPVLLPLSVFFSPAPRLPLFPSYQHSPLVCPLQRHIHSSPLLLSTLVPCPLPSCSLLLLCLLNTRPFPLQHRPSSPGGVACPPPPLVPCSFFRAARLNVLGPAPFGRYLDVSVTVNQLKRGRPRETSTRQRTGKRRGCCAARTDVAASQPLGG